MHRRTVLRGVVSAAAAIATAPFASLSAAEPSIASTTSGRIKGLRGASGIHAFKGVPYGADTSLRRFLPPLPVAPWTGVRDAVEFAPVAPQPGMRGRAMSEDCLHLNVWTPAGDHDPLPVMVWVHGGENEEGSTGAFSDGAYLYDGSYLAAHGPAVVVTINYRLGSLGFLAHPALDAETEWGGSGNYALLDQIAALRWVADNAAAFGGDRSREAT